MRSTLILILGLFFCISVQAQLAEPVQWTFKSEKVGSDVFKVTITANIDEGWYVYSQDLSNKGPVPTHINFDNNPQLVFEGKPIELGDKKEVFDQNFNTNITKLLGKTTYTQLIKLSDKSRETSVKGKLLYMTCNGEMCMPPKNVNFNISLNR
jgi:Disulphide bond corrector protein DsbC